MKFIGVRYVFSKNPASGAQRVEIFCDGKASTQELRKHAWNFSGGVLRSTIGTVVIVE
jgi:hypothetical protein